MKMTLCVSLTGQFGEYYACKDVPAYQRKSFEPLKTCDEPVVAHVAGDMVAGSQEVAVVLKTREDTAKELAKELAPMIVAAMKKNDTHNGYEI